MLTALLLFLATMVAVFVAFIALGVAACWMLVRSVRRSRIWNRGGLVLRTATAPHRPGREVARLRIQLYDAISATGQMLTMVPAPLVLGSLARDLRRTAAATDQRLQLLGLEPDRYVIERMLPPLRSAVTRLCAAAGDVRATAWQFAGADDAPRIEALTREVADQIAGLRAGLAEVQALRLSAGY
jgi:hypothetical protein